MNLGRASEPCQVCHSSIQSQLDALFYGTRAKRYFAERQPPTLHLPVDLLIGRQLQNRTSSNELVKPAGEFAFDLVAAWFTSEKSGKLISLQSPCLKFVGTTVLYVKDLSEHSKIITA